MSWRDDLLAEEEKWWGEIASRFDRLEPDAWERAGACGEWNAKDVLAHIAAWHARTAAFLEYRRSGETSPVDWGDVDETNRTSYDEHRAMTLDAVRRLSASARARFREEVGVHPEEAPEGRRRLIAGSGHEHYHEHLPLLDAFLEVPR